MNRSTARWAVPIRRAAIWAVAIFVGLMLGVAVPFLWLLLVPLAVWAVYRQRPLSRGGKVVTGLVTLFIGLVIIGSLMPRPKPDTAAVAAPAPPPPSPTTSVAPPPPPPPPPAPAPVLAPPPPPVEAVTRVIDGDTFVVASGRTVRVLGIDSCEARTAAGARATMSAQALLVGVPVVLRAEPGVGADRNDRDLRYVELPGGRDFGAEMVREDHTAVYQGENDASVGYVNALSALDANGRTCADPVVVPAPRTTEDVPDIDVPNPDLPNPRPRVRVGRDGDGDGLCNESTIPVPC